MAKNKLGSALISHKVLVKRREAEKRANDHRLAKQLSIGGPGMKKKRKAAEAATNASISAKAKAKAKGKQRATYPFEQDDTILLIGEANFSYAKALIQGSEGRPGHAAHLVLATSYDSEEIMEQKYPDGKENVTWLKAHGAQVEFNVDAGALDKCKAVTGGSKKGKSKSKAAAQRWSRIVFNFPHAGAGITDQDRNILTNQTLLLRFLASSSAYLTEGSSRFPMASNSGSSKFKKEAFKPRGKANGKRPKKAADSDSEDEDLNGTGPADEVEFSDDEDMAGMFEMEDVKGAGKVETPRFVVPNKEGTVLVTLRNAAPYTLWDLTHLATKPPQNMVDQPRYRLLRSFTFDPTLYPGYAHRRTIGFKEGLSKEGNEEILRGEGCKTWEFAVRERED